MDDFKNDNDLVCDSYILRDRNKISKTSPRSKIMNLSSCVH